MPSPALASARRWDIALLCLGCPAQEMIAHKLAELGCQSGIALCVGASIDFLTGARSRAPRWLQRLSLEWAYRLAQEPSRLWRRYLVESPKYCASSSRLVRRAGAELRRRFRRAAEADRRERVADRQASDIFGLHRVDRFMQQPRRRADPARRLARRRGYRRSASHCTRAFPATRDRACRASACGRTARSPEAARDRRRRH